MNLIQIETLVAIAETGTYRNAARKLNRNQPALSKTIHALEAELGLSLLQRSQRGAVLTQAGEAVYKRALTILADVSALKDEASTQLGQRQGRVRVGVSPAGTTVILPRALALFRRDWPEVAVEISPVLYPDSANALRDGGLDLAIGPVPVNHAGNDLVVEALFDMPACVVTSKDNPLRTARTLTELHDAPWIIHGPAEGPSSLFSQAFASNDHKVPKSFLRSHSISATLALIEELDAFCILSNHVFEAQAGKYNLARVSITDDLPHFQMSQVTYKARPPTPAVLAFSDCVRRRCQSI
jgi:LysR family transcriptional regulator of abg operon